VFLTTYELVLTSSVSVTKKFYSLLTNIVWCADNIPNIFTGVGEAGEAQVTNFDVTLGKRLRQQYVLWLKEKKIKCK
jgi:hypothetical protein